VAEEEVGANVAGEEVGANVAGEEVGANVLHAGTEPAHAYVLHAGTARNMQGELVSAGGRVLNVVGAGRDVAAARAAAYELAGTVQMRGGWYRRDIAAGR
jgi:phosphoribosylamine--glycine ligase